MGDGGTVTIALAGDTMLGRGVADQVTAGSSLFSAGVREVLAGADLVVLNLECCVSSRGERWDAPEKPFFFRAPPRAAEVLAELGVDCVTLANNHALDYGVEALTDTIGHLTAAGIRVVGAGGDRDEARSAVVLEAGGLRVAVVGVTDHPAEYAAAPDRPGVAYADLAAGVPGWLQDVVASARRQADVVIVTPHWGPNMTTEPLPYVHRAADALLGAGANLIAGHSAHVFHGVRGPVLYDLGDMIDDYAVDRRLRNDLGLLFLVDLDRTGPTRVEVLPLALDFCHTRLADLDEHDWIHRRFVRACSEFGTRVRAENGRLIIDEL